MFVYKKYYLLLFLLFSYTVHYVYANERFKISYCNELIIQNDTTAFNNLIDSACSFQYADPCKTVFLLDSIIRLAKEKKEYKLLANAYNRLGIIYANAGDLHKANDWIIKGYNISFENKYQLGIGKSINNLAVLFYLQKDYTKSLEYINHAISIYRNIHQTELIGSSYISAGRVYKDMGDKQRALDFFQTGIRYLDSTDDINTKLFAKKHIAEIYLSNKEFEKSFKELEEIKLISNRAKDNTGLFTYFLLLGDYYTAKDLYDNAKESYQQAHLHCPDLMYVKQKTELLKKMVDVCKKTGNFADAFKYQNELYIFSDSLNVIQKKVILSKNELQDEYNEKMNLQFLEDERKKEIQQSEVVIQKRISVMLFTGLLFLLVIGIISFIYYRQKLKNTQILANQRNEILLKNEALRRQMETDREKNELIEFIHSENEILSLVAKETDNSVFIIRPDGIIEWVNEAFHRLSGFSLEEFKRLRGKKIQDASTSNTINENFEECLRLKKPITYTSQTTTKNKQEIWIHTTLTPILNDKGEVVKLIAIDTDITKIKLAKQEIDQKNMEITSSLIYASKIQSALLPPKSEIDSIFPNYFVINLPLNIVSGDFYWMTKKGQQKLIVVADSTGHGVPGAFMSLLGISSLQEIVYKMPCLDPAQILEQLRQRILFLLHYDNTGLSSSESWDIAVCVIDETNKVMNYAGSNNSAFILRDDVLIELKADKFYIWDEQTCEKCFTRKTIELISNDKIYLFTDGFSDQFGGEENKKFSRNKLKKMLLDIYSLPMESQKELLSMIFKGWKGHNEQIDDIMVFAFQFE